MVIEGKQINEWIERAFKNAVRHGWHEEKKPTVHWLMMIMTEVVEAIQADRKGEWMIWIKADLNVCLLTIITEVW